MTNMNIEEGSWWRWLHGERWDAQRYMVEVVVTACGRVLFRRKSSRKLHELTVEQFQKMFVPVVQR